MIFRVNKTKDYTVMSNTHLRDKRLSLKAKGLLSQMLSLPENWDFSLDGIVSINRESESAVKAAMGELKKQGYLVIRKITPDKTKSKRLEYIYDIYETPNQEGGFQGVENQAVENQAVENQAVENRTQLNTKELNTKESNTKKRYVESDALNDAIIEWLIYKKEKRQGYVESGLKRLIAKINNLVSEHGEAAVIDAIYDSMANGWAGIYVKNQPKPKIDESKTDLDDIF